MQSVFSSYDKMNHSRERERDTDFTSGSSFIIDGFLQRLFLLQPSFIRESNRAEQIKMVRAHTEAYTLCTAGSFTHQYTARIHARYSTLLYEDVQRYSCIVIV